MTYYKPKWLAWVGLFFSALNSAANPLFGFFLGKILFAYAMYPASGFYTQRDLYCGLFLMLAFAIAIFAFIQQYVFGYVGENLTLTLREKLFSGIIYKHVAWFDSKDKAPGILTNILAEDVSEVRGLSTETVSIYLEAILGIVIGLIIAFRFTWQMALVALAGAPFVVVGGVMMSRTQMKSAAQTANADKSVEDAYKEANALLSDIIMNYRTIIGFGHKNIELLMAKYDKLLEYPKKQGLRDAHISGLWSGYSILIRFFYVAYVFFISAVLIYKKNLNPED